MKNLFIDRKNLFPKFALLTLCLIFLSSTSFSQKAKDKFLDGKTFTVELTIKDAKKPKPEADELNFKSGKFTSKMMKTESQFKPGEYTVVVDSSSSERVITFECDIKNGDDEVIHWTGTITGDTIEGTATLSKKEKIKKTYAFSGTLKTKKK